MLLKQFIYIGKEMSMNNKLWLLSVITVVILLFSRQASSEEVVLCEECTSNYYFENLAKSYPSGSDVVIINPATYEARKYRVIYEPMDGKMLIPRAVDQSTYDAIETYKNYKFFLEEFLHKKTYKNAVYINTLQSSAQTNGCGAEGSSINPPEFIFHDACNAHDICYSSGTAKAVCDATFLADMQSAIVEYLEDANAFEEILMSYLLEGVADVYHYAVDSTDDALEAYCNAVPDKSLTPECQVDNYPDSSGGVHAGTTTSESSGMDGTTYGFSCELWRFPNGNGGHYYITRNCTIVFIHR